MVSWDNHLALAYRQLNRFSDWRTRIGRFSGNALSGKSLFWTGWNCEARALLWCAFEANVCLQFMELA
jgi:hypothetical protein